MKTIHSAFLLLLLLLGAQGALAQTVRHVVLISIDGLRPEFYQDAAWPAPNLQALARRGAAAVGVNGVFPTSTYPSHTSLVTGASPARHGIFYNTAFAPASATPRWFVKASQIRAETLWDATRKAGLSSAAVSWPVSAGAPIDFNLPEIWFDDNPADRSVAISAHATPKGLFEEVEKNATGKLRGVDLDYRLPAMDENNSRILAYLIRSRKPALAAIHLVATDAAQHAEGRGGEAVRKAVANVDHAVGTLVAAIGAAGLEQETVVVVTGDHGFADVHVSLAPNVWLAEAGLFGSGEDWQARFHASGGAAFLHLGKVGAGETALRVREILAALPAAQRKLFRLIEGEEARRLGADPAAALALTGTPGVLFLGDSRGPALRRARGGTHGYVPESPELRTGFIAAGPGIPPGGVISRMDLVDVAPTVARLLGIPLAGAEGTALPLAP
jgi:arylsulfatase A-like enzyme